MQVSRRVYTEVSQEEHLRMGRQRVGTDHAWVSPTERSGGGGGTLDARSYAQLLSIPPKYSVSGVLRRLPGNRRP